MKIDRLISIILILLDKKRIGARELADMFEVSPRTVYRDINAIDAAGVPIRSVSGVGGGFEIMPQYKMEKSVFTAADLSAILMGLYRLTDIVRGDELINALAKVKSFIPAEKAKEIELKADSIRIDVSPWMGNGYAARFSETIHTALRENRLLSFDYADCHGNKTARTVEPYRSILKSNRWYLQGYCRMRNDFRLFRLNRMTNLRMRQETFAPRECPCPQLEFHDAATLQTKIKLRVHASVLDRVSEYCAPEDVASDGAEYYTVLFPFIENEYYYDILLGFGNKCECLEPPHVRAEMRRRLLAMLHTYDRHAI